MRHSIHGLCTIAAMALVSGHAAGMIPEPPGQQPGVSDERFDAVCAVGKTYRMRGPTALDWIDGNGVYDPMRQGGNTGSGTLIAPNLVLTARHLWSSGVQCDIDGYLCGPSESCGQDRKWTVRFRRHPNGMLGTMEENPIPPNTARGPDSFYYVDVVGAIELPNCDADTVVLVLEHDVTHIDPMPMLGRLTRPFPGITPNFSPSRDEPDVIWDGTAAGWGSVFDSSQWGGNGQLRYAEGWQHVTLWNGSNVVTHASGTVPIGQGDSGGAMFIETEAGDFVLTMNVNGSQGLVLKRASTFQWTEVQTLDPYMEPAFEFDFTGSAVPGHPEYGSWDGAVDLVDLLYIAAEAQAGNLAVDLSGSSDPASPSYGVPDGVANLVDLDYAVHRLATQTVNPAGPWTGQILVPGGADHNTDRRFTSADYSDPNLSADEVAKFDFDRDGVIGSGDLAIADQLLAEFGHGVAGDLNADGVFDEVDRSAIVALLASGTPWDRIEFGHPDYHIALDANLDGFATELDRRALATVLLPGEIGTATDAFTSVSSAGLPDFVVTRWDRLSMLWNQLQISSAASSMMLQDLTGSADPSSPAWGVPDEVTDIRDLKYFLMRHYEVYGPNGVFPTGDVQAPMWAAFDADGDGRVTYADYEYLQALDPMSPEAAEWDLDNDGVFEPYDPDNGGNGEDTFGVFTSIIRYGWNHGALGDFDGSTTPTECCLPAGDSEYCHPLLCTPAVDTAPDCEDYRLIYEELCNQNEHRPTTAGCPGSCPRSPARGARRSAGPRCRCRRRDRRRAPARTPRPRRGSTTDRRTGRSGCTVPRRSAGSPRHRGPVLRRAPRAGDRGHEPGQPAVVGRCVGVPRPVQRPAPGGGHRRAVRDVQRVRCDGVQRAVLEQRVQLRDAAEAGAVALPGALIGP